MLIAVSADGKDLSGVVSEKFEESRYLLMIETDAMSCEAIEKKGDALALARIIVDRDCEAVITGSLTPEIFNVIADACVTRYKGGGLTVAEAVERMDKNALDYIRYSDEHGTCPGEHSGGECNCGLDEED